jgi:hypothetical protein
MSTQQTRRRTFTAIMLTICLSAAGLQASQNPGAVFLMIWPTARSTALAGAMTGLADDPDAAYWNPGGLGFQAGIGGCGTAGSWLPGLYPGMYYIYGSAGIGGLDLIPNMNVNVGVDHTYFTTGETDVVNERGEFLGRYTSYDMTVGLHAGAQVTKMLGVGISLKYIRSYLVPEWVWQEMPELGMDAGGTANDGAVDVGVLYRPARFAGIGLTLANIGPKISYNSSGESDPLPLTLRIGGSLTPIDNPVARLRVLLETDKILVGAFRDTTGRKSFGRKWSEEARDAWKSAAVEVTMLQLLSFRAGYFEDVTGQRGGIVMEREGQTYHYGLGDVLTRKNLGTVKAVGLCWGVAFSYKDYLRLDLSSDAQIYDFPTENWKLTLAVNDLVGMLDEIGLGPQLDWMR